MNEQQEIEALVQELTRLFSHRTMQFSACSLLLFPVNPPAADGTSAVAVVAVAAHPGATPLEALRSLRDAVLAGQPTAPPSAN